MTDLPTIEAAGEPRVLGCLPTSPVTKALFKVFSDRVDTLPRSEWRDTGPVRRGIIRRTMDQDGVGSCAAEASAQSIEICRSVAGLGNVLLSPGNLYGRVNGGRDRGSTLGDNLREVETRGICTESLVPHLDWQNWNAPGWEAEGKKYRVTEIYLCGGFDAIITAALLGYPVVFGMMVGDNFNPGSDGWLPEYTGGVGGHAMVGYGARKKGSKWGLDVKNSWSTRWGDNGWCIIPQSYFETFWEDAWAVRVTIDPSQDGDL